MRILFLTVANKSHLHIATPLAWALRTAGHEVCLASQPDLADTISSTGLTGVAVGRLEDVQLTTQMSDAEPELEPAPATPADPQRGNPLQSDYAADDPCGEFESLVANLLPVMSPDSVFDDLVGFARRWQPDLVIWDMLTYAGPVAARACGAAHARLVLATDGIGQLRSAVVQRKAETGADPLRDWLQPKLERYGCEFAEDVAVGQWTIDPMPSWTWHPTGVDFLPVRHVPFNGPAMAPDWLFDKPTRRRVCLTLGNSHRDAGRVEASAADLLEAVADLDVEVIATLSAEQLGAGSSLPDNIRAVEFVPLNLLLPTCAAMVHHGGAGTFWAGVEHGIPQLIMPSNWWSEKWFGPVAMANGVQERGAGIYVADSDRLSAAALRKSLLRVLDDPAFTENAAQLRKEALQMPTPNDIVPVLEKLTAQHRDR
jgi:glycosyltransferase (activator-dependent family)